MKRFFYWLTMRVVAWFQKRCEHDPSATTADILEGEGQTQVRWCQMCGAVQLAPFNPIERPRSEWRRVIPDEQNLRWTR